MVTYLSIRLFAPRRSRPRRILCPLAVLDVELSQIVAWRQNEHALDALAEISPKMVNVSGDEMRRSCCYRGQENWHILVGQNDIPREASRKRIKELNGPCQFLESSFLDILFEVDPCFFQGVVRGAQRHILKLPKLKKPCICTVRC